MAYNRRKSRNRYTRFHNKLKTQQQKETELYPNEYQDYQDLYKEITEWATKRHQDRI